MSTLRWLGFTGEIPRLISRMLPDTAAEEAFNTRLDDGALTPIRLNRFETRLEDMPPAGYKTIYKHKGEWLAWEDFVFAVPGHVAQDRLYIFGDGAPKMRVDGVEYGLAVTAPVTALVAAASGSATSDLNSTRLFVYTSVTQFGEESEPSPLSNELNWFPGQTITLSGFDTAMANGRTAAKQRIYGSQSGTTGTQLFLLEERVASTDDYVVSASLESISSPLRSLDYNPPPDGLTGVISLPNGIMVGFVGKEIYFCEPYIHHAWPIKYSIPVDYKVVGLAAYGTTVVVMTDGHPYIISGSAPENMQSEKLELNLPCINARGIQDLGYSVAYPSHDGLVLVSNGSAVVGTAKLLTRTDWQNMRPETIVSGRFNGRYLYAYHYSDESLNEYAGTLIFDVTGDQPFIIRSDITPTAFFYDIIAGELFYLDGDEIWSWDAPGTVNAMQFWRSKEFILPKPTNFGAMLIDVDSSLSADEELALDERRNKAIEANQVLIDDGLLGGAIGAAAMNVYSVAGDAMAPVPHLNRTVSVNVFADNKHMATVSEAGTVVRLPSGFLARSWKIAVASDMPIAQISMATTGAELMGV